MKILVSDHLSQSGYDALANAQDVVVTGPCHTRAELLAAVQDADALIIRSATRIDAELLAAAPKLKVAARAGARLDNIDLDEATRRGVMVVNVPDANLFAVAELTFGMLLALARQIPAGYNALKAGEWPRHKMLGFQLHGKVLGIIGFGGLGRAVAARAQAFGMQVLAYDPYIDLSLARELGVEIVGFDELLARSDILTPQTPLTEQTYHIFNADAFAKVKPGSWFVNCTHAALVDEDALLAALENGTLAGAALDTFAQEPPAPDHPLLRHPRVIVTPHLNQNTFESQKITGEQVVTDVLAALHGRDYRNVVNLPFNKKTPYAVVKPYIMLASKLGKLQGQLAGGWIKKVEVELLGDGLQALIRPVTAVLLSGMLLPIEGRPVNWVSAPVHAFEQGIETVQGKNLLDQADYPNLLVCRVHFEGGSRTVAGVLFANGDARLVRYGDFNVDAHPEGFVLILDNYDIPGVIGKVGTQLGSAGININNWRYGRETVGGRAMSFINVDSRIPKEVLTELEQNDQIHRARLVKL